LTSHHLSFAHSMSGSVGNARVLLQRALRVNSNSQDLWLQYFLLECHIVQKLKGRREIMRLEGEQENDTAKTSDSLAIPTVVYDNAIQAIPDSVVFRLEFLDQCNLFPSTEKVEAHIIQTIARDFEEDAQAWIARAAHVANKSDETESEAVGFQVDEQQDKEEEHDSKRQKKDSDGTSSCNPVLTVLEEAIEALPTAEMYVKSIQFLRSYMQQQEEDEEYQLFIHKLLIQAKDKEISSTHLTLEEANVLVHEGKLKSAIDVLKQSAIISNKMEAVAVWLQWAKLSAVSKESDTSASRVLYMALERTPLHSKEQMVILLELIGALLMEATSKDGNEYDYKKELAQLFERMLLLSAGTVTAPFEENEAEFGIHSVAAACLHFLRYSLSTGGTDAARRVYEQVLYRSNYGSDGNNKSGAELQALKEFMDESLEMEKSNKKKQRLGRVYDAAIKLFDQVNPTVADSYRSRRDSDVRYA